MYIAPPLEWILVNDASPQRGEVREGNVPTLTLALSLKRRGNKNNLCAFW
jgi:hypothetical protein